MSTYQIVTYHIRRFRVLIVILCMTAASVSAYAQSREELQKKEQDLQRELIQLNKEYAETQKNKKVSLKQLAIIKNKINKRQELVNGINKQVRQLDETIFLNERDIYRLRRELDTLKVKYAQSIVFAYKNRGSYEYLNFLFSASSFNDAVKRVAYLKSYRQNRETQAETIVKSDRLLQDKIGMLSSNKKDRLATLQVQSEQLKVLQDDKLEQDAVVKQLQGREKEISTQIRDKERQRQRVQQAFNTIIRREIEEAKKREAAARLKAQQQADAAGKANAPATTPSTRPKSNEPVTGMTSTEKNRAYTPLESTPEGREMSINFERSRGGLPWPVSTGVVTAHFGIEKIAGTKLTRRTDGIEISLPIGSTVRSIADGLVVYASEVDGEQMVVVQHGKYFSGYNHLSSISISRGQEVKAGSALGKTGTGIDGEGLLLFMIMNDKSVPQDPESWLKRQK
ncbi:murein hydrolase activator EnvC family protein [Sediminibacterium soli]|uniref:murein hydrolase activator EnvC family protein n=1 Tax=Sediminibacterium soli TaxID=2698829 RepID=UPI00137A75C8|nr:peptidoglycan DD-metalloendopeptidase family protein [Sediminibacterium soli]NCI48041.1 peptidoglycan DD-metalloendopeptidase family protein [Sediminibacterium soli]